MSKSKDRFYRVDGQLTAYGLLCGYQQQYFNGEKYHTSQLTVELYMEHSHYHVRSFNECLRDNNAAMDWNAEGGWRTWDTFDNLQEARKAFAVQSRKMKALAKEMK